MISTILYLSSIWHIFQCKFAPQTNDCSLCSSPDRTSGIRIARRLIYRHFYSTHRYASSRDSTSRNMLNRDNTRARFQYYSITKKKPHLFFFKETVKKLKKQVKTFQSVIHFHPGHLLKPTQTIITTILVDCYSGLLQILSLILKSIFVH